MPFKVGHLCWNFSEFIKQSNVFPHHTVHASVSPAINAELFWFAHSDPFVCLNCCKVSIKGKRLSFLDREQHHSWGLNILWGKSPLVSVFIRENMHTCILLPCHEQEKARTACSLPEPVWDLFGANSALICTAFFVYWFFLLLAQYLNSTDFVCLIRLIFNYYNAWSKKCHQLDSTKQIGKSFPLRWYVLVTQWGWMTLN